MHDPSHQPSHPLRLLAFTALALLVWTGCAGRTDDGDSDDSPVDEGVPDTEHCEPVSDWPEEWSALETEVLELTNLERAEGANCGGEIYPPVGPLTMHPQLRCSARLHSQDMAARDYFEHTTPDGVDFATRVDAAGYEWMVVGENIALGATTAEDVVDGWMNSPGHCTNIMASDFEELGVGHDSTGDLGVLWTQNFGAR
ncbi:MAG TPA: CAP domain-containing protein [Deltaproteobacteria bacterium]|nr:CAP domain-containing protein [Deltaproteobacteria bacterium]|tara:strand:+ start:387 stop:983 length:597 start_codon:yes stop_codon:yes gene_type:complete